MQNKKTLTIVDTKEDASGSLLEGIIRRYASKVTVRVITEQQYLEEYFGTARNLDVLIVNSEDYGDYLKDSHIGHLFLLVSEIDMDAAYPEDVTILMKYLPEDEIFQRLDKALDEESKAEEQPETGEEHETRMVAVYSPVGGCGKSLAAYAIARKLKNLDEKVLLIGCDSTQSLSAYMTGRKFAGEDLAESLKNPDEDTYWTILKYIERGEISYLLPFEKSLPLMDIGMKEWGTLIDIICRKKDFDYLVLDFGSVLDRDGAALLAKAYTLIILTENNEIADRKMKRLISNSELLPECDAIMVANEIAGSEKIIAEKNGIFGTIPPYPDWKEALEDPLFYRIALRLAE
ncbi:MAG: AAA family ATPase [Eubacterium sp.]|nr:AAA family ATPase [Eubacterium sp.]